MNHYIFDDGWRWYHTEVQNRHANSHCILGLNDLPGHYWTCDDQGNDRRLPANWEIIHCEQDKPIHGYPHVLERLRLTPNQP